MSTPLGLLLVRAWQAQRYSDPECVYDEVLREVSARVSTQQSLGKADIGALVLWKRITAQTTWARQLLVQSDRQVRTITGKAYREANDDGRKTPEAGQAARVTLSELPGMGGTAALASTLLLALAPTRMAVWDRRVGTSMFALGEHPKRGPGFYGRYLTTLTAFAGQMSASFDHHDFLCRDVDLALFWLAGSEDLLVEARTAAIG